MKRTLSILVVLVMLVSMFSFMMTGVSANVLKSTYEDAKDGDLLYEVKFGQTSGCYQSVIFHSGIPEEDVVPAAVTITDEGRTLAFYKSSATGKSFWYGGQIEGLTWGGDKKYTITMQLTLPKNRGGIYFNYPSATKKAELTGTSGTGYDNTYHSVMYGFYAKFDPATPDMGAMLGGGKVEGRFRFDTSGYKEFEPLMVEAGTFLDVTFLIEGYSYAIFIDGVFIDVIDLTEEIVKGNCDNLGFSTYIYWQTIDAPVVVKNVNVYKGDTVSADAEYPSYAKKYEHYVAPETTTSEETTTAKPAETTTAKPAETTTAPVAGTTAPTATTTAAPKKEGGCGSAVTGGLALIAMVSLAGVTIAKKRK